VRAFAEHEFGCAFVCREVDAERQVETKEGIFENFDELIGRFARFVEIFDALVFKSRTETVERNVEIDVVAERDENAELKLREIETVVESNADTAVEIGVFKFDRNAFDVEHFEHLIEKSRNKRHFDCVVAHFDAVYESCHESKELRGIHALVFAVFCRESGSGAAAARNIDAEHCEKFAQVHFDFVNAKAKHVDVRIEPAILQIERNDLFAV